MAARVVLVIVVVFAIGFFLWHENIFPFTPSSQASASTTNATPEATPAPPVPAKKAAKPHSVSAAASSPVGGAPDGYASVTPLTPDSTTAPVAAKVVPAPAVDPPPFPQIQQIAPGEEEYAVREKYGNPAISALTSRDGHIERTFVYTRDRGYSETVIHLEDGKVAGAYSKSAPPTPTGISIPRLGHPEAN